jgi:hypothetical protein
MVYVHKLLVERPEFQRLKPCLALGQCWGEGNPLADNLSRGDMTTFLDTCAALGVKPKLMRVPTLLTHLMNKVVRFVTES